MRILGFPEKRFRFTGLADNVVFSLQFVQQGQGSKMTCAGEGGFDPRRSARLGIKGVIGSLFDKRNPAGTPKFQGRIILFP